MMSLETTQVLESAVIVTIPTVTVTAAIIDTKTPSSKVTAATTTVAAARKPFVVKTACIFVLLMWIFLKSSTTDLLFDVETDDFGDGIYMGANVSKGFDNGVYRGIFMHSVEDDDGQLLFCIEYWDEDTKDMHQKECATAIDLYDKLESGEIKEWELGLASGDNP